MLTIVGRGHLPLCLKLLIPLQYKSRRGDVDLEAGTITLYDPKGARDEPRVHVIPLPPTAMAVIERRLRALSRTGNAPVFSTDSVLPLRLERVSEWVTEISAAMVEENESREAFQLRDLRRTL